MVARDVGLDIGRKLRLTKFFNEQDEISPFVEWPKWAQVSAMTEYKSNHARFQFFQFLWRNGLAPHTCGEWTRIYDYQHGRRMFLNVPKIVKHVSQMIRQALNDNGRGLMSQGRVYDLRSKRPM